MIQDIEPEQLNNAYRDLQAEGADPVLCFEAGKAVVRPEAGRLGFPGRKELPGNAETVYAFSLAGRNWFVAPGESGGLSDYGRYTLSELREMSLAGNMDLFAVYTGFHL